MTAASRCRHCGGEDIDYPREICACGLAHGYCGDCGEQTTLCRDEKVVRCRHCGQPIKAFQFMPGKVVWMHRDLDGMPLAAAIQCYGFSGIDAEPVEVPR